MSEGKNSTSWGPVAKWYDEYLGQEDTYQAQVILPNLLRLLSIKKGERDTALYGARSSAK